MAGSIIKSAQRENEVRPFLETTRPETQATVEQPQEAQKRSAMVELIEKLAKRDAEISGHEAALAEAYERGEAEGRALAEEELEEERQAALDLLKESLESSREDLAGSLKSMEATAVGLAHEVLAKLVGEDAKTKKLLKAAIKHQIAQLNVGLIHTISVSRSDFPDTREVAALQEELALDNEKLVVRDDFNKGACQIKLTLGAMDVGLRHQWRQFSSLLTQMETEADDSAA